MRAIQDYYVAASAAVMGDVIFGPGANVWYGCVLRGDLARITLGPRANLQDGVIVHTDTDEPQTIGEGVVVGHAAVLHGRSVGAETLVGIGARLLTRCEVGEQCVIAAGSVVTEGARIPPRSVVMGVPGRVVREVRPEELERTRRIAAHYLELAGRHARGAFPPPWGG